MSDSRPLLPPRLKDWTEMKLLIAVGVGTAHKMSPALQNEILVELEQIIKEKR